MNIHTFLHTCMNSYTMADEEEGMENTKYGRQRERQWTPTRAKALLDTRDSPNSLETHLVRKRWDIGLLRAMSPWMTMMMMMMMNTMQFIPHVLKNFS